VPSIADHTNHATTDYAAISDYVTGSFLTSRPGSFLASVEEPSSKVAAARAWRTCEGGGKTARNNSSGPWVTRMRVHFVVGDRITLYESIELPLIVDGSGWASLLHTRRRRRAFSTDRNFLATYIRQGYGFSILGRANASPLTAVMPALIAKASLVARAGHAMVGCVSALPTRLAAVLVAAVVRTADDERHQAP
jgi:hypothetical protein